MNNLQSPSWLDAAGRRTVLVASLLALVSLFWATVLVSTQLSTSFVVAIAALNVLLLSIAVAWAASALPKRTMHGSA
jgi:hypothetical protein